MPAPGRHFDPPVAWMLEYDRIRISVDLEATERRRRQIDLLTFYSVNNDRDPLCTLCRRRNEPPDHGQNIVGGGWKIAKPGVVHSRRGGVACGCRKFVG